MAIDTTHSRIHLIRNKIDWRVNAPDQSIVVTVATSRYPNELIKLGKLARRLNHTLLVLADSSLCPLTQFAHEPLMVPSVELLRCDF